MKKRVLAILLAATMLLSENSVVSAAEEILNAPVQINVLEEMEDPEEAVSADDAKTETLSEEEFTGSQPSGEEISWNALDLVADDPEEPFISTNDRDEMENLKTESANITEPENETENPQAAKIAEPQAAADSEDVTADFKDPNFQAVVRDELGLEEDEPIAKTDCKAMANLDVSNKEIKNLAGIEYFTNLFYLNCSNNQLTSLDLSKCLKLETLRCENNQLSSLNVSKCSDLSYLYCQNNQLTKLDLSNCTKMEQINCYNNKLTNLDMSKCAKLRILDCGNNQLDSLDMSECANLESLSCYNNKLTSLDINKCAKLEDLSCNRNKLTTLKLVDFPALTSLYCSDNSLTSIQFGDCPALTILDCSNNKFKKLSMDKCPALSQLSCFGNELTSLDLNDCPALKLLLCNANKLTRLNIDACLALESLNCAFNELTSLNIECASLTLLECTDNKLSSLNLSGCPKLQTLGCGHNQLSSLDLEKCPDLDQLFCRNNKLTKLDISKCARLIYIDCRDNYMKSEASVTGRNAQLTGDFFMFHPQKGTTPQTFTITFDKNASKASLAANKRTKKITKGKTYGDLPTPSLSGYYFQGWYTARSGGKRVTSGTTASPQKNHTLYAHWIKADLNKAKITVKSCTWNGKAQKPKVTITLQGVTLKSGSDYTLSYSSNKNPGKGKVTVKGKGVFARSKSKTVYFTISKATQTITAKNAIYKASDKGKTMTLKVSVKGGAKLTYASSKNDQIRILNKNSSKLKLMSPGAATITIKAAETRYYKAATKKVTVVLQGTQSITLTSRLLSYNKTTKAYTLNKEIFNQAIGVSVKGNAAYVCSVTNSGKTTAWFGNRDQLTARGQGTITVTVQTEKTKDGVYPAAKKTFTILLKGMPLAGDWSYQQSSNGSVTLLKYLGSASQVTVPNILTIDGKDLKVTALGDGAFENLPVQKVTIQESSKEGGVLTIGKAAFKNCASLSEIRLNSKTTSIGEEAFCGCTALKSIWLPEGLKTLPARCLKGCSSLEGNLYLPEKLTSIGTSALEGCSQIRRFVIHSYLTNVADNAFKNCGNVKTVYYSGCQERWNGVRIGQGNDALRQICCNAGGDTTVYSFSNISEEDLYYRYPQYLSNEGFDTITRDLEGNMMAIMAGYTASDTVVAAMKSAMMQGAGMPVYCLKAMFEQATGTQFLEEDKVDLALALELVTEASELSLIDFSSYSKIYSIIKEFKDFNEQIFMEEAPRDQLASRLAAEIHVDGWNKTEIKKMLKTVGENDNWIDFSKVFKASANTAGDFLMTFITLNLVSREPLDRLYEHLPENSRLHNGVRQLRNYLDQPLETLMAQFIGDAMLNDCLDIFQDSTVNFLNDLWNYNPNGFNASNYFAIAGTMYKVVGTMMYCPTIEQYNNAWVSLGNASVLHDEMMSLRAQLNTAAQNGIRDKNLQSDYEFFMTMYMLSLKKANGYVASTMTASPGPEALNARFARYEQTLNYNNYLLYCKSQIN